MNMEKFEKINEEELLNTLKFIMKYADKNDNLCVFVIIGGGMDRNSLKNINELGVGEVKIINRARFGIFDILSFILPSSYALIKVVNFSGLKKIYELYLQMGLNEIYVIDKKFEFEFLEEFRKSNDIASSKIYKNIYNEKSSIILKFYLEDGFDDGKAVQYLRYGSDVAFNLI